MLHAFLVQPAESDKQHELPALIAARTCSCTRNGSVERYEPCMQQRHRGPQWQRLHAVQRRSSGIMLRLRSALAAHSEYGDTTSSGKCGCLSVGYENYQQAARSSL